MGKRPDVIVVGGGVNGTSITYRLAEAGRSVLLLEQRGIASGASGRNGGMTGSGAPHPTPEGMAGHRIREANTELMRRLPDELGVDFDLRLEGSLDVATTEAMFDDLKHAVDALDAAGLKHDSRMLDTYEARQLAPALEKAVNARGGAVKLVKLNIDDHPAIPGQMGIQSIPAVIAFKDGQPVDGFMGALPESQIVQFLDKLGASSPQADAVEQALEMAKEQLEAGAAEEAAQIYAQIMSMEPENHLAIAGLAGILADNGGLDQARELIGRVGADKQDAPEVAAVRTKIELAEQVAALGDDRELEARLAADPKDHQARYDLAMIENARGNRQAAADHLLAIFKADRAWNDDAARQRLLQFFEAWGPTDEVTLSARRQLSSLLFS